MCWQHCWLVFKAPGPALSWQSAAMTDPGCSLQSWPDIPTGSPSWFAVIYHKKVQLTVCAWGAENCPILRSWKVYDMSESATIDLVSVKSTVRILLCNNSRTDLQCSQLHITVCVCHFTKKLKRASPRIKLGKGKTLTFDVYWLASWQLMQVDNYDHSTNRSSLHRQKNKK